MTIQQNIINADSTYLYNGKELDGMNGLNEYDYGSRWQDPTIGRWPTMDPLVDKYYSISPYAYCAGNPVRYIDPTGMSMDDYQLQDNGKIELIKETDVKNDLLYATYENGNADKNNSITIDKGILDNQKSSITDHDLNTASGKADRAYRLILSGKGNLINILDHSHFEAEDIYPSGFPESKGIQFDSKQSDKANAKWLKNYLPEHSVLQRVYNPTNGEYLRYNSRKIFLPQIK